MLKKTKDFEDTTVWLEVQDILKNSKGTKMFHFKGTINTPIEDVGVWELNVIETIRNYKEDVSFTAKIQFRIGLGDYINRIHPHRHNLEFTLTRTPIHENGTKRKEKEQTLVRRYKAILNPKNNPPVAMSDIQAIPKEDLNNIDMPMLQLELLDRCMEPLRIKLTSGVYRDKKLEDIIRATLGHESQQILVDGKPAIDAIDVVAPENKAVIEHVIFPSGTRLTGTTTMLQEDIGIYNRGLGTFFQTYREKKTWFVYPLFDSRRFDEVEYKAIFYAVPQEKLPQLDRSYWEDGKLLKVAVTAQRLYNDSAEIEMMNRGSGFRMADANAFMKKPIEINEENPKGVRSRLNHEVVTKERDDGLDYAPMMSRGPSANPYMAKSEILSNTMAQVDFIWENADDELIYPGMPCKYVYLSQGKAYELKGTILFLHIFISKAEKQDVQAFRTVMRISMATEVQKEIPELEYKDIPGEPDAV